jgi:hypothetical protein
VTIPEEVLDIDSDEVRGVAIETGLGEYFWK